MGHHTLSTPTFSIILSLTRICQIVGVLGKFFLRDFLEVLGGDRAWEPSAKTATENLTWRPGQSIRTETFMLFIHSYRPNALPLRLIYFIHQQPIRYIRFNIRY